MSEVFHRHTRMAPPRAVAGDGPYLIDDKGRRYLDASGGAAVSCLGHSHREVIDAIKQQLDQVPYAHTAFFTSEVAERLAEFLVRRSPGQARVYFVSGGSEAMEASLKLARQYFLEKDEPQRRYFIARRQSYHGNTLGALAVGGNQWRRQQFEPLLMEAYHISPCYEYRDRREGESSEAYGLRVADELEEKLQQLGAENVIAFIAEPVVGATAGALPAVPGYFRRIREICDRHGILLILDEVMCGMGRTGTLFAAEQEGIEPDMVAIAKGLGAGYQPIGALLSSAEIYRTVEAGSGFFQHGHTYMGHPTACAAALAVQHVIERDNLLENVRRQGSALQDALRQCFGQHPHIGDIRGRGLFVGLEIVADRETKAPFDPALAVHQALKHQALQAGLMCYPMSGTLDGRLGHHVLLAPPYIIGAEHVDEIVDKLERALQETSKELGF
ncbi:MAG: aspartate aminotransferase family protein [Gammaproteobacteria bacterium]|nr:aspartate aminotransferase family protein [Gammaproteobacteria bacterium]